MRIVILLLTAALGANAIAWSKEGQYKYPLPELGEKLYKHVQFPEEVHIRRTTLWYTKKAMVELTFRPDSTRMLVRRLAEPARARWKDGDPVTVSANGVTVRAARRSALAAFLKDHHERVVHREGVTIVRAFIRRCAVIDREIKGSGIRAEFKIMPLKRKKE